MCFFFFSTPWLYRNRKKIITKNTHAFIQMDLSRCLMWMCIDGEMEIFEDERIILLHGVFVHRPLTFANIMTAFHNASQLNLISMRFNFLFSLVDFSRALLFLWRCVRCRLFTLPIQILYRCKNRSKIS